MIMTLAMDEARAAALARWSAFEGEVRDLECGHGSGAKAAQLALESMLLIGQSHGTEMAALMRLVDRAEAADVAQVQAAESNEAQNSASMPVSRA